MPTVKSVVDSYEVIFEHVPTALVLFHFSHFNVHILDASSFTCSIGKLEIYCNCQKLRPCREILMVKRNIIFPNSHICYAVYYSTVVLHHLGYLINDFCLFFSPLEKSGGFFWSNVLINQTIYSTFLLVLYPISSPKSSSNFQYCFLLSRGDVGAM